MQQGVLWDGCATTKKAVARCVSRKTDRRQSRRSDWEDFHEPEFHTTVSLPIVPPDTFADVPPEILPTVRKYAQRFHLPITLPDPCSEEVDRAIRQAVYSLRHANRLRLKMPDDAASREPDLPEALEQICRAFKEEMLAQRGLRSAAHGISRVDPNDPSRGWRVQVWGDIGGKEVQGIRVGHIHVGYAKSEIEAHKMMAAWWLKNRRLDIEVCFSPESAIGILAEMMGNAAINAGNAREDAAKLAELSVAEVWGDDED
jgi:hypothetical protein